VFVLLLAPALALAPRLGRRLGVSVPHAFALLAGVGLVVALTLTPSREALRFGTVSEAGCDLTRIGLAPLATYLSVNETSLNVLLLVPLGLAVGSISGARRRVAVLGLAVLLPFAVELLQFALPGLDRLCQSGDVVDNLAGLLLGFVVGAIVSTAVRRLAWSPAQ
jgi:glycopeptide antibiotics resistance protein